MHEGGFALELQGGETGARNTVVRGPGGRILPRTFAEARAELPVLDALRVPAGTRLHDETLLPWWDGRPLDLDACVDAGLPRKPPPVTH